jgi:asparagine synthase (glutamine-hydrolysing)
MGSDGAGARDIFDAVFTPPAPDASAEERIHAVMSFEAETFLHGLLVVEDKVSMAHGLESRIPFLDNDLVEFASSLALRHKLQPIPGERPGFTESGQRTSEGKRLLRKALAGFMPPEIVDREKQGFSAPDASWFKGQSIDYVRSRIGHPRARIYQFIDHATADALLQEHFQGVCNRRLLIWSLIYLEQALASWKLA